MNSGHNRLNARDRDRIDVINRGYWIDCALLREPLNAIINLIGSEYSTAAPCMLVCGEGGSGKTGILEQLKKKNKNLGNPFRFMTMTESVGNHKLKQLILNAIGLPTKLGGGKGPLPQEVSSYLRAHGIRGIVIDEFHEGLMVPKNEQLRNLSLLKGLSGSPYYLSIIPLGTKEAKHALMHDPQLARRYYVYQLDPFVVGEDFRSFLATYEKCLALKNASNLHDQSMVHYIYDRSEGVLDSIVKALRGAACYAIANGEEKITEDLINLAISKPWSFI